MMATVLKSNTSKLVLSLAAFEALLLIGAFFVGLSTSWVDTSSVQAYADFLPHALLFAFVLVTMMYAVGLYNGSAFSSLIGSAVRLAVAFFLGLSILLLAFYILPGLTIWRAVMLPSMAAG